MKENAEGRLPAARQMALDLSFQGGRDPAIPQIPFRQAVAFGQIVQWSVDKVLDISNTLALDFNPASVNTRLRKAKAWLETYNPQAMLKLNDVVNSEYAQTLSAEALGYVRTLREALLAGLANIDDIESQVYAIPKDPSLDQKENSKRQRAFFKNVYNLLLGSDTGPRLSTFLWAVDREHVMRLLDIQSTDQS